MIDASGATPFPGGEGSLLLNRICLKRDIFYLTYTHLWKSIRYVSGGNSTGPLIKYIVCSPGGGSAPTQQSPTVAAEEAIANLSAPAAAA